MSEHSGAKLYPPAGRCIYCPALIYDPNEPTRKLGDEHIIPLGIGGRDSLPDASCLDCERETSAIETECISKLFDDTRPHLGIKTRGKSKNRKSLRLHFQDGRPSQMVPKDDHPGIMMMFNFPPADIFFGSKRLGGLVGNVVMRPLVEDFRRRVIKQGNKFQFKIGGGINVETFGRMLAKIGHAYATAELGIGSFRPFLPPLIVGAPPYDDLAQFVGGAFSDEPAGTKRHELSIITMTGARNESLIVVRVRLFSDLHMPAHYVVAGTPL
jgi:hypothetical protein